MIDNLGLFLRRIQPDKFNKHSDFSQRQTSLVCLACLLREQADEASFSHSDDLLVLDVVKVWVGCGHRPWSLA